MYNVEAQDEIRKPASEEEAHMSRRKRSNPISEIAEATRQKHKLLKKKNKQSNRWLKNKRETRAKMLQSETQIADQAVSGLDKLQNEYDTLKTENEQMQQRLKDTEQQKDQLDQKLTQFESTTPSGILRKELSSQMEALVTTEESLVENVIQLIKMKQPQELSQEALQDKTKLVDIFMDIYFPTIQVAMKDYRGDGNPQGFLDLYNDNYALFQFIEPLRISHEVYFTDSSEGYLDELLLTVFQRMPKDKDKLAVYSRMCAPIFLHSDVIDEYPLHKLNEREFVLSPILQSMIPTLRKNPDVFAKLLIAMKSHNRERDALLFGDMYLFKDATEKHPELKDIFESLAKQDILRQKQTSEGLQPGVDKTHCDKKIEDVYNSLKRGNHTPISSADLLLMTQCEQQSKGPTDILY